MHLAITRQVSRAISRCELTFLPRVEIDVERARLQHAEYERILRKLGLVVLQLPEAPELPDSVFVEDTALVLDECALLLRPGAESRRAEVEAVAQVLGCFRDLIRVEAPAKVDGGDILRIGHRIFIGQSQRTDDRAVHQIGEIVRPMGYSVEVVGFTGCLHLKSAATAIAPNMILVNPEWVSPQGFPGVKSLPLDPSEPQAANGLLLGETLLFPRAFPRTAKRLKKAGFHVLAVEADELAKAEGALTCCSLILNLRPA